MTDKAKFFFSIVIIFVGLLLAGSEGIWLSKLGWVTVGVGIGGVFIIGGRNIDKLFSSS